MGTVVRLSAGKVRMQTAPRRWKPSMAEAYLKALAIELDGEPEPGQRRLPIDPGRAVFRRFYRA